MLEPSIFVLGVFVTIVATIACVIVGRSEAQRTDDLEQERETDRIERAEGP